MSRSNISKIIESRAENHESIIEELALEHNKKGDTNDPDLFIIQCGEKESIGIEKVKGLTQWAYNRPFFNSKKRIIIIYADLMTNEAQNSILKITEEPPQYTEIFLIVENHKNLLETIVSRSDLTITKSQVSQKAYPEVENFLGQSIENKFKFTDELSKKKREEIKIFLDQMIIYLRNQNNRADLTLSLLDFKKNLSANVSKKLILDNLVLKIDNSA
jgi:DNA polymerase III delta prime subunit